MWDPPPSSTWSQEHPHAHSDVTHYHRSRKRLFTYHLTTAPAPQHLQTCLSTGKETEAQSQEEAFPQQVHGIVGTRTQLSEYPSASYHFPWATPGFSRKDILGILPQLHGPKYPGHKFWHRPKTMFTPATVNLVTPNVYNIWLDFLYSSSISKCT